MQFLANREHFVNHLGKNTEELILVKSYCPLFSLRVLLYSSYTILIHLCEVDGHVPFSNAAAVLVIEVAKVSSKVHVNTELANMPSCIANSFSVVGQISGCGRSRCTAWISIYDYELFALLLSLYLALAFH